ncbi:MAG: tRNA (N6-threonylcarbamoyladenosine(37)-N6)-methyltransferase TrmO [Candidatus Omnitrophota bacterium]|nr:MAG: tRNA (N6-threonylcarbamoyladenosine(37)-N6)-methyltransferase TrmO [Candidatus Omnitrophota bacterium]
MKKNFKIEQIGIIHSPYKTKNECPIQGQARPEGKGQIELFPEYEKGLETIETFSHIILFYIFDQAEEIKLSRLTFLDDSPHGVFASRHPCRPNSIGISIVKLEKRNKNILEVSEIDVLDNTPLIDIKPYIPKFDFREKACNGWTGNKEFRPKPLGRE